MQTQYLKELSGYTLEELQHLLQLYYRHEGSAIPFSIAAIQNEIQKHLPTEIKRQNDFPDGAELVALTYLGKIATFYKVLDGVLLYFSEFNQWSKSSSNSLEKLKEKAKTLAKIID